MTTKTTWKAQNLSENSQTEMVSAFPYVFLPVSRIGSETEHGALDTKERKGLPDSAFAFPRQRKEPLTDADPVRSALAPDALA